MLNKVIKTLEELSNESVDSISDFDDKIKQLYFDLCDECRRDGHAVYKFLEYTTYSIWIFIQLGEINDFKNFDLLKRTIHFLAVFTDEELTNEGKPILIDDDLKSKELNELYSELSLLYESCNMFRVLVPSRLRPDGVDIFANLFKDNFQQYMCRLHLNAKNLVNKYTNH